MKTNKWPGNEADFPPVLCVSSLAPRLYSAPWRKMYREEGGKGRESLGMRLRFEWHGYNLGCESGKISSKES